MNIFQFVADMLHLFSFLCIIHKILKSKGCAGIVYQGLSLKTQEIYLVVFIARYNSLFYEFISIYNTLMKITFIMLTISIIYLMKFKFPYSRVPLIRLMIKKLIDYLIEFSFILRLSYLAWSSKPVLKTFVQLNRFKCYLFFFFMVRSIRDITSNWYAKKNAKGRNDNFYLCCFSRNI